MIDSLLTRLEVASLQGAIGFALVWTVCRLLPRLPADWRCWLWRLVIAKFLVSVAGVFPVSTPAPALSPTKIEALIRPGPLPMSLGDGAPPSPRSSDAPPIPNTGIPWLGFAWAFGFSAFGIRSGLGFWRARRLVRSAPEVSDATLAEALRGVLCRARFHRLIRLAVSGGLFSPVVWGLGHRTIVVPPRFEEKPASVVEAAFAHEVAHLVRRDASWSLVGEIARCLFWFHPLVWIAQREQRAEAEIACDRLAREWTRTSPRDYASHLLTLVGPQEVRPNPATLQSTHELTRRFEAMSLVRYSPSHLPRVAALAALPLVVGLAPFELKPNSPDAQTVVTIPTGIGFGPALLPLKRSRAETERLAIAEGLNTGGATGPLAALRAVERLERGQVTGRSYVARTADGGEIELLGLSHIEPGRSRSWRPDGTPLPDLLPFTAGILIPTFVGFERQAVIRVTEPPVRGLSGFFQMPNEFDHPEAHDRSSTLPVPGRLYGDRLLVVQQEFPEGVYQSDLVLRYFTPPRPLATLMARNGRIAPGEERWKAALATGNALNLPKPFREFFRRPTAFDTVLSLARPKPEVGSLRVIVVDKKGRTHRPTGLGSIAQPDLSGRSSWIIYGVSPANVGEIRLAVAQQATVTFRGVHLHPAEG